MPSADRLERLTNQLVNIAEADMVAAIETTEGAYGTSRLIVVSFAVGSILLALGLGYIISWSLIEPVKKIEARLSQIAAGDFAQQVAVANRDELGALAENVNQTSEQLGQLYQEVQARNRELNRGTRAANGDQHVSCAPSQLRRPTFNPYSNAVSESAVKLCDAYDALILLKDGGLRLLVRAHHGPIPYDMSKWPIGRDWVSGPSLCRQEAHPRGRPLHTAGDDFPEGRDMAIRLGHRTDACRSAPSGGRSHRRAGNPTPREPRLQPQADRPARRPSPTRR